MSWLSRSACSSIRLREPGVERSRRGGPSRGGSRAYALMEASGVFSSCEALATKSWRTRSSRRKVGQGRRGRRAPRHRRRRAKVEECRGPRGRGGLRPQAQFAAHQGDLAAIGLGAGERRRSTASLDLRAADQLGHAGTADQAPGPRPKRRSGAGVGERGAGDGRRSRSRLQGHPASARRLSCWRSRSSCATRAWSRGATSSKSIGGARPTGDRRRESSPALRFDFLLAKVRQPGRWAVPLERFRPSGRPSADTPGRSSAQQGARPPTAVSSPHPPKSLFEPGPRPRRPTTLRDIPSIASGTAASSRRDERDREPFGRSATRDGVIDRWLEAGSVRRVAAWSGPSTASTSV